MFDIKGLEELQSGVKSIATTLRPEIQQYVGEEFKTCADNIRRDCPVDTGKMKRSIKVSLGSGKGGELARIDIPVPYAQPVEFGHKTRGGGYVRGRNFVTPNVNKMKSKLRQRAGKT